jgi:hypothetical protein
LSLLLLLIIVVVVVGAVVVVRSRVLFLFEVCAITHLLRREKLLNVASSRP